MLDSIDKVESEKIKDKSSQGEATLPSTYHKNFFTKNLKC